VRDLHELEEYNSPMSDNWHQAAEFVKNIRGTALFPFLVTDVVTGIIALTAPLYSFPIQLFVLGIFAISIASTLICCLYFMINDPDRLGSEIHIEKKMAMGALVGDERHSLGTRAEHIVAVVNPRVPISDSDSMELPPNSTIQSGPLDADSLQLE